MIKILSLDELNLQDDCIFNRPAFVLYASGCKWNCEFCHSKNTWDFNQGFFIDSNSIIPKIRNISTTINITLVGEGGDFFFQLNDWLSFIRDIRKEVSNNIKIIWYTGAEINDILTISKSDLLLFNTILCGKSFFDKNDKNIKNALFPQEELLKVIEIKPDGNSNIISEDIIKLI